MLYISNNGINGAENVDNCIDDMKTSCLQLLKEVDEGDCEIELHSLHIHNIIFEWKLLSLTDFSPRFPLFLV